MISYFPDLNVWVALAVEQHVHHLQAANWLGSLEGSSRAIFSRYTQIGLLRLLTNAAVMGTAVLTLGKAWADYERFLEDPRIDFFPEPGGIDAAFLEATVPHFGKPASKAVGDCYLLAFAKQSDAALVTFDKGLLELARKHRCRALVPA